MPAYLLELYVPRAQAGTVAGDAERARHAARELAAQGTHVKCLHSVFVPEDETCFHLYEADAAADVIVAAVNAGLAGGRIVEAVAACAPAASTTFTDHKESETP